MAVVIDAPNEVYNVESAHNVKLFLAGGITNCPDWQSEMIKKFDNFPFLTIYNPRRKEFPIDDPNAAEEQITWEYIHLQNSQIISFWFSKGSLNPIVLYELGMWANSRTDKKIFIGIDPEYERKQDVIIQTSLAKRNFDYFDNIDDMSTAIKNFIAQVQS